jgi:3-dehydroquinate synthase
MKKYIFAPGHSTATTSIYSGANIVDKLESRRFLKQFTAVFAIVDEYVYEHYSRDLLKSILKGVPVYVFPRGERHKSLARLQRILNWLWENEADRDSLLLGIGGGVVTDIAGFAASCYMRGIAYVAMPTTLLAQVDAAVGGKTAVNLHSTKNVIGSFYMPQMVICDSHFLSSLRTDQIKQGLVEAIKVFAATDRGLFDKCTTNLQSLINGADLNHLMANAIAAKLAIVNADPYEKGLRRVLNLGHTTGHAVEAVAGWSHGKSVALGILVALMLSQRHLSLSQGECNQIWSAITTLYGHFDPAALDAELLWEKIKHDKKRSGGQINFVLLPRCGSYQIAPINYAQFTRSLAETRERLSR